VPRRFTVALFTSLSFLVISCGQAPPVPKREEAAGPKPVKITQFYPASAAVPAGSSVTVCYGVENAVSVSVIPPVDELKPAANRCFEAPVPRQTEFRLIARGASGDEASASFIVGVTKATAPGRQAREATDPVISSFTAEPPHAAPGAPPVKLCYQTANATSVTVEPKVADLGAALMGCFYAPTSKTTTYVLTARGPGGKSDVKRVTVSVP
jgi:hypothetical protein